MALNSLRNGQTLDWSTLNAPADDKIKVLKMMIPHFDRVENIVGKGENAGLLQCFQRILFLLCFQRALYPGSSKVKIVSKKVKSLLNDKIQNWSKLKAPADNKIKATEKSKFVSQRVENKLTLYKKEKMLVISIFSFSHNVFNRPLCQGR